MTPLVVGLAGLALCGLYLVLSALPLFQPRPTLEERLRRFDTGARLRDQRTTIAHATRPLLPWAPLDAALRPLLEDLVAPIQRLLLRDGVFGSSVERQLRVVHPVTTRQAFVAHQLLWAAGALALFLAVFVSHDQIDAAHLLISLLAGAFGFLMPWLLLRRAARTRRRRLLAELPHVARLLAMGMSASLPLDVALDHVGARSHGPLGQLVERTSKLAAEGTCGLLPELARRAELEDLSELSSFVGLLHWQTRSSSVPLRACWRAPNAALSKCSSRWRWCSHPSSWWSLSCQPFWRSTRWCAEAKRWLPRANPHAATALSQHRVGLCRWVWVPARSADRVALLSA